MEKRIGLSAIDIAEIVREFQSLLGSRVQKAYQSGGSFSISLATKSGGTNISIVLPGLIFSSQTTRYSSTVPTPFSMELRRYLINSQIKGVEQLGHERILAFNLSTKAGELRLVVELFSKGNLILLDSAGKILSLYSTQSWSSRELRRGEQYKLPPSGMGYNPSLEQLREALLASEKPSIVQFLAVEAGLGGAYAEEVCLIGGFDKREAPSKFSPERVLKALEALLKLPYSPTLYLIDGVPHCIARSSLKTLSAISFEQFGTMSGAAERCALLIETIKPAQNSSAILKLEKAIAKQKQEIERLENQALLERQKGEYIYTNYTKISSLLEEFARLKKAKGTEFAITWLSQQPCVASVNPKQLSFVFSDEC